VIEDRTNYIILRDKEASGRIVVTGRIGFALQEDNTGIIHVSHAIMEI